MNWKVIIAVAAAVVLSARAEEPALAPVFNGKDLTGWKSAGADRYWSVQDGVLVGQSTPDKKGHVLVTEQVYGDVIVECECRWNGDIDSGIFLRKGQKVQCQIGVSRSLKKDMTGSIYVPGDGYKGHSAEGTDKLLKAGDWNKIRFAAIGQKFTIWLNGQQVLEWQSDKFPEPGPIGLQIHANVDMKVEFRNLQAAALAGAK